MPQIRSKQIKGEVPVNPTDLTTKAYVDALVGSGGTSSTLTIQDENLEVLTGVTIINFIGSSVSTQVGGLHQVNIYIPPASYAPYFNASGAAISNVPTFNRYVSNPTSPGNPFDIGSWTAGTSQTTIRNTYTGLTYYTPVQFSILNYSTTFTATVLGADGSTPISQNIITLSGNSSNTSSNIRIDVYNWSTDSDRYKAQILVNFDIVNILPNGGKFSIKLEHNNETLHTFNQNNIFRDREYSSANISGSLTVVTGSTVVTKQISGVYFYTTNTQWHVHLNGINNLNSNSYPTTQQLQIVSNNLFCSEVISASGVQLGSWTNAWDNSGATYDKSNWTINQQGTNWNGTGLTNSYATATIYDWSAITPSTNSIYYPYLIDTYVDYSDRNSEMFRTENNVIFPRLMSDCTTSWDNTTSLDSVDGGTGLQIIGDKLVYPQYNFSIYQPNIGSQPDYSSLTGNKSYYRKFETTGLVMYNVIISLSGHNITESDISSGNVKFEISADKTKWLNVRYEFFVFDGGTSCRIESDVYSLTLTSSIKATFENFRPEYADNYTTTIYLKITYSDTAKDKYINSIDMMGDYWA